MARKVLMFVCCLVFTLCGENLYLKDIDTLYLQYADSSYNIKEKVLGAKAIALETKSKEPNQKPLQNVYELQHLLKILVKNSEDSILTFIMNKTNRPYTKDLCISTVTEYGSRSFRIKVFSQWALEDSTNLKLLPYHPNGPELLLDIMEDKTLTVTKRDSALNYFSYCNLKPYYERIKKLESDTTIRVKAKGTRSQVTFGDRVKRFLDLHTRSWKK